RRLPHDAIVTIRRRRTAVAALILGSSLGQNDQLRDVRRLAFLRVLDAYLVALFALRRILGIEKLIVAVQLHVIAKFTLACAEYHASYSCHVSCPPSVTSSYLTVSPSPQCSP